MFRTPEAEKILSVDNYAVLRNVIQTEATNFTETDIQMYVGGLVPARSPDRRVELLSGRAL